MKLRIEIQKLKWALNGVKRVSVKPVLSSERWQTISQAVLPAQLFLMEETIPVKHYELGYT